MSRYALTIGWDGTLYDCDFNQMLDQQTNHGAPAHIRDIFVEMLNRRRVELHERECEVIASIRGFECPTPGLLVGRTSKPYARPSAEGGIDSVRWFVMLPAGVRIPDFRI